METEKTIDETLCVICQDADEISNLRNCTGGIESLLTYSKTFDFKQLSIYLSTKKKAGQSVKIHEECQKNAGNHVRKRKKDPNFNVNFLPKVPKMATRKSIDEFDWKKQCLFCGKPCTLDEKHVGRRQVWCVTFLHYRDTILKMCDAARQNDEWAEQVRRRVINCTDLVQAEARYHDDCRKNFCRLKDNLSSQAGRPTNSVQKINFEKLCDWLECESEVYSLTELHEKMIEIAGSDGDVWSRKWMRTKLKEKYGSLLFFTEVAGKSDVVCFKYDLTNLVNNKWYEDRKSSVDDEAKRIIEQAAKLIQGQIRAKKFDNLNYPSYSEISDINMNKSWIPSYLRLFLETLITKDLKQASIGQAIVSAVKPRSAMSPIMFGLGIEVDKVFGSRWLLTELNRLGFSIGYNEVVRYKQSVVCNENISDFLNTNLPGSFSQWSADNVDHNTCTIDGKGSLHGMGIVVSSTPGTFVEGMTPIKRQKMLKAHEATHSQKIPVVQYDIPECTGLSKIKLKPLLELQMCNVLPHELVLHHIWHSLHFMKDPRPSWSGYMNDVSKGDYPGKSTISLLPVIDLKPTDMSCVYSTLKFIEYQAAELGIVTPVITFDQQLWIKAIEIIEAKSLKIVCMLGGFHLLMNFLGSIGVFMSGSGVEEVIKQVYAENSVQHIMSGKAISRALRAHFLVESALVNKLMDPFIYTEDREETVYDNTENDDGEERFVLEDHGEKNSVLMVDLQSELERFSQHIKKDNEFDILQYPTIIKLEDILNNHKDVLKYSSRTAKLWLQYLFYIDVVKIYIRAERTGDFNLYLEAVSRTINLFAATGHINYAKCSRLHLQNMLDLHNSFPWVHKQFSEGRLHTIRRSDRFWAGLWGDLIIEQVMMRALKSNGGLTRGKLRGVDDSARQLWLGSMHRCADIHNAMAELTKTCFTTSEQHVDLLESRVKRENEDLVVIQEWFDLHEPWDEGEPHLKSLSSGLIGDELNCDDVEVVGLDVQRTLDGMCMEDAIIKRSSKVRTFQDLLPSTKIGEKSVYISPTILFSRLTALAHFSDTDDIEGNFSFELTPEPTSLFKQGLMRKPVKANLRNNLIGKTTPVILNDDQYDVCIYDGGMLLHKVYWPKTTFSAVLDQYVAYLKKRCFRYKTVNVVFDGYSDDMSIKSQEHERRTTLTSATISVNEATKVLSKREVFLSNQKNKTQLIKILSKRLEEEGFLAIQSSGDADVLIVKQAVEYAQFGRNVVVMAEDTDILILMLSHWKADMGDMFIGFENKVKKKAAKKLSFWNISMLQKSTNKDILLFAHAWTGCDTTSAIFQKGKIKILDQLKSNKINELCGDFGDLLQTQEDIGKAGVRLMVKSYGGKDETLTKLRHDKYMDMVATSNTIRPEILPPTERATYYHALRVHLQVAQWKHLCLTCLDPKEWGWRKKEDMIEPIKTDIEPAPAWLLQVVRCNCKIDSRHPCGTRACSCRKNGLTCVAACGGCHGEQCDNSCGIENEVEEDENEDERNIFEYLQSLE